MNKRYNVAVVGATGLIGEYLLKILEERDFPIKQLTLVASPKSVGQTLVFRGKTIAIKSIDQIDFSDIDLVFFAAGSELAKQYAKQIVDQGAMVIDTSSAFRNENNIELIVPEINGDRLSQIQQPCIIANPNCSTIQMLMAIYPIYQQYGIERIDVATYQAVSGMGRAAMESLTAQTDEYLTTKQITKKQPFLKAIGFNVIPLIDQLQDNQFSREEMKMVLETRKILNDDQIQVAATAVRVPVLIGHSEAIHIKSAQPIDCQSLAQKYREFSGVELSSDPLNTPFELKYHSNDVYVSRLRADLFDPTRVSLWSVADNLRKGGALNAVQIAERLLVDQNHTST